MNKKTGLFALLLALAVAGAFQAQAAISPCCVAGEYSGSHTNVVSRPCPVAKTEPFTMSILQARGCGEKVWGKVTDAKGDVQTFTGTVKRGPNRCCILTGILGAPGHETRFTGTLCRRLGKWQATGTYRDADGCTGTWEMKQI